MKHYFNFCSAQARPLQYKNCYNWSLACEIDGGVVYYYFGCRIVKTTIGAIKELHRQVTHMKPVQMKPFENFMKNGAEFKLIEYAINNQIDTVHISQMDDLYQKIMSAQ